MKYGENLKIHRLSNNLSLKELSKKTNISFQNLSRWEREEVIPNIEFCNILADFYEISIDDLIGRDFPPITKKNNSQKELQSKTKFKAEEAKNIKFEQKFYR